MQFSQTYNSKNIDSIKGESFDLLICAGIQAKKWWANQNPEEDLAGIQRLLRCLESVTTQYFVLISTVDVYPDPRDVTEQSTIDPSYNHPYGKNRYEAEKVLSAQFPHHLILRLPGLFGNGIKKNIIHDLLYNHELGKINPEGVYQYYSLDCLAEDIQRAQSFGLKILNVACEPVNTEELRTRFFPETKIGAPSPFQANYNMLSNHWHLWPSGRDGYLYDKSATFNRLEKFLQRSANVQ